MRTALLARLAPLAGCLAAVAGCADVAAPEAPPTGRAAQPIIGGVVDAADPAVVMLDTPGGGCSGTLVSPKVILTAAHCVSEAIERDLTDLGSIYFGGGAGNGGFHTDIGVADMVMYRLYEPPAFLQYDIAMIRLEEAAPSSIDPIPINFERLTQDHVGLPVVTVGFGVTDGVAQTGFGTKRKAEMTVDEVAPLHLGVGDSAINICQGDSGGPTFAELGGERRVIGVSSYGSDACMSRSSLTRTDIYQEWAEMVIDAWDGPCEADGTCVTDGCRNPDPDCDPCGLDGVCQDGCAAPDHDCPLGTRVGQDCREDGDCESRRCIDAPDAPGVRYCSQACDPAAPLETCAAPLSACVLRDGEHLCEYNGATPGTQGAYCVEPEECRSGACDTDDDICVDACGEGDACPDGFDCRAGFCQLPEDGGCGCRAAGPGAGGAVLVGLAVALAGLGRRRRRPRPN